MTYSRLGTCMIAAALLTPIATTSAHADAGDDYVACLIGRAAVVLHKQAKKDSGKALEAAYKQCKQPKGIAENELEGIGDYASMQVEAMAGH